MTSFSDMQGEPQPRVEIARVDLESEREAFEYGFGLCRDNSVEGLAAAYSTAADTACVARAVAADFPVRCRPAVLDGCAAGFSEQARRGGPRAEQLRTAWFAARAIHEDALAAFALPEHRHDFIAAVRSTEGSQRLRAFEHHLDRRRALPLPADATSAADADRVVGVLEDAGAPATCFTLIEGPLDGRELPLSVAVTAVMSSGGGVLSCVAGRLALYVANEGSRVELLTHEAEPAS